ncbi:MAG: peptidase domain-containing ABC transporter [Ktedonobacteraceae bacterium]|nr:peptidase domain-containing ABC transporter [Ktedonobacteraceae bacterium]
MRERQFKNPTYWSAIAFDEDDIAAKPTLKMVQVKPEGLPRGRPRRSLRQKLGRRRVPQLSQMSMVECGAACLAMILCYYGRKTSVSEVSTHCDIGRDGLSALSIVKAARSYGMRVRAVSLPRNDFRFVRLPAIIHWEFNHFVVVERWSSRHVDIVDPAAGRRRLSAEEFDAGFTGITIMLEPGTQFNRKAMLRKVTLRGYLLQYIRQTPLTLLQILGASLILQAIGLMSPLLSKFLIDDVLPYKQAGIMTLLAVGMILIVLSQIVTSLLREWLLAYLRARLDTHMMVNFFEHLLTLPYSFFQKRSSGDLLTRLASNTAIRDTLSSQLISTILDASTVVTYLWILFWQSRAFGLLTIAIGTVDAIVLLSTTRPIRELMNRELAAQGKSQGYTAEALTGMATLKAAGAEQRALERWSNLFFDQLNVSVRRSYISAIIGAAISTLRSFSTLALLWLGATQVLNGSISIGTMFALNTLATSFLSPLSSLVSSSQQLQLVHSHLERIADITETEPEQDIQAVHQPPKLSGSIQLAQVSFRYAPDTPLILHSINLMIQAGQKVAIVGRTGSGKSTLGRLLLGLYLPTEGLISYDGIPLQTMNYQEVRRQFGVVLQDSSVFSGSVLQNITLNNPNMGVEQAAQAAEMAAIHDDIIQMPMGYETFVSEGGSALSGGQRQRLALARALASSPSILLLDEATSHLDVITEQKVEQNLQKLACTQIIIAHRLSTIRNADLILVLDQGTIVERGSHHQLMARNGYYAHLMQQQQGNSRLRLV